MKNELIEKFTALLETDDISTIKHEVRDLISNFNSETVKEKQLQSEKWKEEEHEEGEEFSFHPNEVDETFESLIADYRERVKEYGKKLAEEQKENLEKKKELLASFESLIKDEENIGKAFHDFKELQEKWNTIGNVPGDKYEEIHTNYLRLRDEFFYNINIYKQLQEYDLQKNEEKKLALIEKIKVLKDLPSISETDTLLRSYRKEWDLIGPSSRENYERLGDEFFGYFRENIEKIQNHYDGLRAQQEENLIKKKELVEQIRHIVELEIINHATWKKKTDEVIQFQKDWKSIGFASKKENEEVWQEFRGICDLFFDKKHQFYEKRKEEQVANKAKKESLIEKAKKLQDSENWRETTDALIQLQKEWKSIGTAAQRDEQSLWSSFRGACDAFFKRKEANFANMGAIQVENLRLKQELIKEIETFEISGNRNQDLEQLREFSNRWRDIGYIPKKDLSATFDAYNKAMDAKYDTMKLKTEEKSIINYKQRIEKLKDKDPSGNDIKREKRLLREKIERLKKRVVQYENNMNFFSGKGAEAMKKDVDRRINASKREIEEIKRKLQMF